MQGQDFRSFDWDDSQLIRAYNRGLEARKANKIDSKNNSEKKENKKRKWRVGDYCRALYSDDNLFYEAKIISMNGDFCTVEFVGYDDTEDVDLLELKESEGRKARKQQLKACLTESSVHESETAGETTDGVIEIRNSRRKKSQLNQSVNNATIDTTMYEGTINQQYAAPAPALPAPAPPAPVTYYAPPMPTNMPFMPPAATIPQYSVPAAPPMPQCPNLANNPAFQPMLTAWYMAGYYTGIHSVQKENHGCQHCCSHSNRCCRN